MYFNMHACMHVFVLVYATTHPQVPLRIPRSCAAAAARPVVRPRGLSVFVFLRAHQVEPSRRATGQKVSRHPRSRGDSNFGTRSGSQRTGSKNSERLGSRHPAEPALIYGGTRLQAWGWEAGNQDTCFRRGRGRGFLEMERYCRGEGRATGRGRGDGRGRRRLQGRWRGRGDGRGRGHA